MHSTFRGLGLGTGAMPGFWSGATLAGGRTGGLTGLGPPGPPGRTPRGEPPGLTNLMPGGGGPLGLIILGPPGPPGLTILIPGLTGGLGPLTLGPPRPRPLGEAGGLMRGPGEET